MPKAPHIDSSFFGTFVIDGNRYQNDVVVFWNGQIEDRKTNHEFTKDELGAILVAEPQVVVVGTGYSNLLRVAHDAEVTTRLKGIEMVVRPTVQAVQEYHKFARLGKRVVAVLHSTC